MEEMKQKGFKSIIDTTQEFQTAYGYQSFYYQEIHIENPKILTTSEINKNKQQIEEMFQ